MFIETLKHIAETYVNFPTYFVGALITVVMLYFARRIQTYYEFNVKKYHEIEDADSSFFFSFSRWCYMAFSSFCLNLYHYVLYY